MCPFLFGFHIRMKISPSNLSSQMDLSPSERWWLVVSLLIVVVLCGNSFAVRSIEGGPFDFLNILNCLLDSRS